MTFSKKENCGRNNRPQRIRNNTKILFDILHRRSAIVAQELRYSALEVVYYAFGLKCLVPAPL